MNWRNYKFIITFVIPFRTQKNYKFTFFTHSYFKSFHQSNILRITKTQKLIENISKSGIQVNNDGEKILENFVKTNKNQTINYSFVADELVARDIVKKILLDMGNDKINIIEYNPGIGFITLNLIKNNVSEITVINTYKKMNFLINNLISTYSDNVKLSVHNFSLEIYSKEEKLINTILQYGTYGKITNIIAVLTNYQFLSIFTFKSIPRKVWENFHSVNFYICVEETILNKILSKKNIKFSRYCLFHSLFTIDILDQYPREAFLPLSRTSEKKMILVKVKTAPKYIGVSENNIEAYLIFLRILERKQSNFVIPTLEKFIPDCGIHLISKGISMILQTQDLSATESVELFNLLTLYEGFENFKSLCPHLHVYSHIFENIEDEEVINIK